MAERESRRGHAALPSGTSLELGGDGVRRGAVRLHRGGVCWGQCGSNLSQQLRDERTGGDRHW